ncbi:hypothetical protein PMAYCL1PPCAC_11034, partial [Pristionchus mayeri]
VVPPPSKYSVKLDFSGSLVEVSISLPPLYPISQHPDISISADPLEFNMDRLNMAVNEWISGLQLGSPLISGVIEEVIALINFYKCPISSESEEPVVIDEDDKENRKVHSVEVRSKMVDESHNFIPQCEICYKDLVRKRTLNIGCHEFHRTCLLNWCESKMGYACFFNLSVIFSKIIC